MEIMKDVILQNSTTEGPVVSFFDVWNRSSCQPLEKLVSVVSEYPHEVEHVFKPSCVSLRRCCGCCRDEALQCVPVEMANITMEVGGGDSRDAARRSGQSRDPKIDLYVSINSRERKKNTMDLPVAECRNGARICAWLKKQSSDSKDPQLSIEMFFQWRGELVWPAGEMKLEYLGSELCFFSPVQEFLSMHSNDN
ncbi:Placenta growth factor, partial [Ophiophagus hannah]